MYNEAADTECLASFEFVDQCGNALLASGDVRRSEIDQIAGVSHNGLNIAGRLRRAKVSHLFIRQRTSRPLSLILDEDLQAIAADTDGGFEGQMQTPGNGKMRSEALTELRCGHRAHASGFNQECR